MYAFKCKIWVEIILCENNKSVEWYKTWNSKKSLAEDKVIQLA